MPCGDQLVEFFEQHTEEHHAHEMPSLLEHDHEHQNHVDLCSPFCMCNCCSTPVTMSESIIFEAEKVDFYKSQFFYSQNYYKTFINEIFQPPQS